MKNVEPTTPESSPSIPRWVHECIDTAKFMPADALVTTRPTCMYVDRPNTPPPVSPLEEVRPREERGVIIHRGLEIASQTSPNAREKRLARYLSSAEFALSPQKHRRWKEEILNTINSYQHLFDSDGQSEVPVAGEIFWNNTRCIRRGVIDRLVIKKNMVWIVEFKSDRIPPYKAKSLPKNYMQQLCLYKELITNIYPEKTIKCLLIWTYIGKSVEI